MKIWRRQGSVPRAPLDSPLKPGSAKGARKESQPQQPLSCCGECNPQVKRMNLSLQWSDDNDTQIGPLAALESGFQSQKPRKFKNTLGCHTAVDYL